MKSPYVYFGGKGRVADVIWARFGNVKNTVEPFFGSGAVLLRRPSWHFDAQNCVETVNDLDANVPNFWRAIAAEPHAVAHYADLPICELDLHARHRWLVQSDGTADFREQMRSDPHFYDVKRAGWWVWGINAWIGSGWCEDKAANWKMPPNLTAASGRGAYRQPQKLPMLSSDGRGIHQPETKNSLTDYFAALSERMRRVRVCCGDWSRIMGPSVTFGLGTTGILLDPPYSREGRADVYAEESDVADEVRAWCIENGDNPKLRICLAGYDEHNELASHGWSAYRWKANGGYGSAGKDTRGRENAHRETLWFSPHCLHPDLQRRLFDEAPQVLAGNEKLEEVA